MPDQPIHSVSCRFTSSLNFSDLPLRAGSCLTRSASIGSLLTVFSFVFYWFPPGCKAQQGIRQMGVNFLSRRSPMHRCPIPHQVEVCWCNEEVHVELSNVSVNSASLLVCLTVLAELWSIIYRQGNSSESFDWYKNSQISSILAFLFFSSLCLLA